MGSVGVTKVSPLLLQGNPCSTAFLWSELEELQTHKPMLFFSVVGVLGSPRSSLGLGLERRRIPYRTHGGTGGVVGQSPSRVIPAGRSGRDTDWGFGVRSSGDGHRLVCGTGWWWEGTDWWGTRRQKFRTVEDLIPSHRRKSMFSE